MIACLSDGSTTQSTAAQRWFPSKLEEGPCSARRDQVVSSHRITSQNQRSSAALLFGVELVKVSDSLSVHAIAALQQVQELVHRTQ